MIVTRGGVTVVAGALVGIGAMAQDVGAQLPQPETLWPTSVAGWVALFLGFASAVGVIYAVHKSSLRPVELSISDARKHFDGEIGDTKTHFDGKIASIEKHWEVQFNAYRDSVNKEVNGYGTRLTRLEEAFIAQTTIITGMQATMAVSVEDRRHMHQMLGDIRTQLSDMAKARAAFEERILTIIAAGRRRPAADDYLGT
jgi:hypothetical protein